jgi:hydrogenase maturation protease
MPAALALGIEELGRWGVVVRERTGGPARDVVIGAVSQDRYESGRPSSDAACRFGDERFLAMRAAAAGRNDPPKGDPA